MELAGNELQEVIDSLQKRLASLEQLKKQGQLFQFEPNEVVELNVGGQHFTTFASTLTKHSNSMLAAMFSGRHPVIKDSQGRPFIDRNPKMFGLILEYLRTDIYPTPLLPDQEQQYFECEVDYFNLDRPASSLPVDRLFCKKSIKVDSDERMLILCFDVFGDILVIGNRDGSVQLWSIEEGKKLGELSGHKAAVSDIRIAPNISGRMIVVSCCNDQSIRLWDLWSHQSIRIIQGNGSLNSIDLLDHANQNLICAAGRNTCVYDLNSGELLRSYSAEVDEPDQGRGNFTCVKSMNQYIFSSIGDLIKIYDMNEGYMHSLKGPSMVKHLVVREEECYVSYADCSIGIWNWRSASLVRSLTGFSSIISRFNLVGSLIFSGCYNGALLVFHLKSGTVVRTVANAHNAVVRGIKWTDGALYTVGADAKVMVWKMHSADQDLADFAISPEAKRKPVLKKLASNQNLF